MSSLRAPWVRDQVFREEYICNFAFCYYFFFADFYYCNHIYTGLERTVCEPTRFIKNISLTSPISIWTLLVGLLQFVKHLGRSGITKVDETEKGWFIAKIDSSPKALAKAVRLLFLFFPLFTHYLMTQNRNGPAMYSSLRHILLQRAMWMRRSCCLQWMQQRLKERCWTVERVGYR